MRSASRRRSPKPATSSPAPEPFTSRLPPGASDECADGRAGRPGRSHRDRVGDRRHDLRVVRQPDRAHAEQARWRRRDSQLRHREGTGQPRRRDRAGGAGRRGRAGRLHRRAAATPEGRTRGVRLCDPRRGRAGSPAAASARRHERAECPGDRPGDDPGAAVHLLAVAQFDPRRPGRGVGGVAVPPGRLDKPQAWHLDHGHADLPRHPCRVRLVAVRAVPRHRRRARHDPPVRVHQRSGGRVRRHLP